MSTYQRPRQRTQTRLIEATITCLLRDGFDRLTVTAIAAEADVGRGTFYSYFEDVEDVLLTISRRHFLALQADVHAMMVQYESPEKEMWAWQMIFERTAQFKLIFEVLNHPRAIWLSERFQDVMIEGFKQSLETDSFLYPRWMDVPLEVIAIFKAGAVLTLIRKWMAGGLPYSAEEMGRMVYQMLYHRPSEVG
ncbi:MAG: TetR/AcrR family transcriptional regulator [Anaerolineae bacterium]|nr:TetR/AcrR family transcriptional regulator [Anaerolineae bacterium]